ncbi:MAG TPA: helix-turn-helix domain-containing protein [Dokdonella sp.]|uniref:winged helix-turn-helix domain-containing protein n=1 Tax=Dokdonella sp. TaxID=2291710 RepID=UPI0025C03211|nr:helix-turn-helix domain-containing protein [Dokdonella sp.]MBX3691301.1 helix-turn-helix transcriptional regulator [Dokdonella sp.]MCW5567264.1 helix-turn-helix transcriptional regulator [Dokdonella sp.]HNR92085.1 helix-turn-helix domain-containing protein [Dokdonella sp.]
MSDTATIRLLASPARQEIVDTLEALGGEASVAELAAELGRPADSLYYHLRLLVRGRVVDEIAGNGDGRRYRSRARTRTRLAYKPGATANAVAVERVAGSLLRIAGRDFAAAIARRDVVVDGALRELWASRLKGWVGDAELAEINRLLERLAALLHGRRSARRHRLVSLAWVLAPLRERTRSG